MNDYLFFDSNRLIKGERLKKTGRLKFDTAVFYALQLVNAGFYYKKIGVMPDSLTPEQLLVTEDDFLFVGDKIVNYKEFNELKYLAFVKGFFYKLILGGKEGASLTSSVKNYSQDFTKTLDNLDNPGNSLVSFLALIEGIKPVSMELSDKLVHVKVNTDLFDNFFNLNRNVVFYVFPYAHIISLMLKTFGVSFVSEERPHIPFGSYNRFSERFFYLNFPCYDGSNLPDVDSMWKKARKVLKSVKEEIYFFETAEGLDSFSLGLFEKIGEELDNFKVIVLDNEPFSPVYNRLLLEGKAVLFNPVLSEDIGLENYIFAEYSFQRFANKLNVESSKLFCSFVYLLEKGDFPSREETVRSLGLSEEEIEDLKKEKENLTGEKKGFFKNGKCIFPLQVKPVIGKKVKAILENAVKRYYSLIISEKDFLKKHKGKVDLAEFVEKRENIDNNVKAFFWYCADNFKKALSLWGDSPKRDFFSFVVESLYFLNRFDELISFCEKNKFFHSFYYLVSALIGKRLKEIKVDGYCALELAFKKRDFKALNILLNGYGKKDAVYYRFYALYSYFNKEGDVYLKFFEKAIEYAQRENNFLELALAYKHFGNVMYYTEDFFTARDYYLKALKIAVDIENEGIFEDVEYNLSHIDIIMCELDRSYKYFLKAYLKVKGTEYYREQIYLLKALAKINAFASRAKEAESYMLEAFNVAKKHNLDTELPQIHFVLVTIYQDMGDFEKSEYYLNLFEKESDIELFKREITYKKIELSYFKGDLEKAGEYFKKWELKGHDKLQPYLYKWLKLLLFETNLADVYDFYREVESCPLRHTVFLIKCELLKRYPRLVFVLEDDLIERDYSAVRHFNGEFASVYREAIVRKKKAKFDPELFVLFNQAFEYSKKGEVYTVKKVLDEFARWLGLNVLNLVPFKEDVENEWPFVLTDGEKNVCLVSDTEVDNDFFPLLRFLLSLVASYIKFVYSENEVFSQNNECDFFNEIIGKSEAVGFLKQSILKVADFNVPVLITGESGTGKELVARALHYCSRRKRNRFVPINCAAIPSNLLESELFGYEKGAFSGAYSPKRGLLEIAGDGTVFLDEIGEMPLMLQAKLLRVLQEREFTPLGSTRVKKVNARFVFATNRNLKKLIKEGKFREDLYFRINAYTIKTPSLNERREDIPLLAVYFLKTNEMGNGKSFSYKVLDVLKQYDYKGNVRELQNIITGAIILSGNDRIIDIEHLPEYVKPANIVKTGKLKEAELDFRRRFIKEALARYNGNYTRASKELGISRQRLHQLADKLGIKND